MAGERIDLLKNMPIFGGLTDESLGLILELSRSVVVAEGEYFFRQNDAGNATYVLERGRVAIWKLWDGAQHLLRTLGPGDCFGEMALIDFGPRSASVQAETESAALEMSPGCLLEVAKLDLEQYAMIYMNMARELSRRMRHADERLFRAVVESRISRGDFDFSSG